MTPAPESPDAALELEPGIAVDKDILDCWRVNYGLHREPHALHEFWRNGAPAGAVLALRAAVLEIERLHASPAEAEITRLTAERDAALRDAERWRALQHVFHVGENTRGSTMMSANWAGWVSGEHTSVNDWADAYAAELRAQERGNV